MTRHQHSAGEHDHTDLDQDALPRVPHPHRAGGGATTRSLPKRPTADLPQSAIAPVQRRVDVALLQRKQGELWSLLAGHNAPTTLHDRAAAGVGGPGGALPHLDTIQQSFGAHDVRGIRAHVGGAAATASAAIGARAYATGTDVALADAPDLHTAAHEAAHVVQQRGGVQLLGGVGQVGDPYEAHADAVADRVVAGQSAVDLLDPFAASTSSPTPAIQRKGADADALDGVPGSILATSPGAAQLAPAHSKLALQNAKAGTLAAQVQSGALTPGVARQRLTTIIRAMYESVQTFATAIESPLLPGTADALAQLTPDVLDALNEVARTALLIDQADIADIAGVFSAGAGASELRGSLAVLSVVADTLGWHPPTTLAQAEIQRDAFEPCRIGAQLEHPDQCPYADAKRTEERDKVMTAALQIVAAFNDACRDQAALLEPLLKARAEARKATIDVFAKVITIGVSAVAPGVGVVVGIAANQLTSSGEASATADTAGKIIGTALDHELAAAKGRFAAVDDAPEGDTINMLATLRRILEQHVHNLEGPIRQADDDELTQLRTGLQGISRDDVDQRVANFVARYRSQIEPIGHYTSQADSLGFHVSHGRAIAATIDLGGRARPALVKHLGQVHATPNRAGRIPGERFRFVRWLDADLAPLAGPPRSLDAAQVEGLSFGDVAELAQP